MRKIITLLFALTLIFAATSCAKESVSMEFENQNYSEYKNANVELENDEKLNENEEVYEIEAIIFDAEQKEEGSKYELYSDENISLYIEWPEEDFLTSDPLYFYVENHSEHPVTTSSSIQYSNDVNAEVSVEDLFIESGEEIELSFFSDEIDEDLVEDVTVIFRFFAENSSTVKHFSLSFLDKGDI